MMDDRQLLTLAATAAGCHANEWVEPDILVAGKGGFIQFIGYGTASVWNPLTDDGDALRLAVKLDMGVEVMISLGETRAGDGDQDAVVERHGSDPYAATRRAITRAAAAMAKETE